MQDKNETLRRAQRTQKSKNKANIGLKIFMFFVLIAILIGGYGVYYYQSALKPVNSSSNKQITVKIPMGSSKQQISQILDDNKLIKSKFVFNRLANKAGEFKAGNYMLSPKMSPRQIIDKLQAGQTVLPNVKGNIVVREGANIDQIADEIQKNTKFSKKEFLDLINDDQFVNQLAKKYPKLLSSAKKAKNTRYKLEGYLYPATYALNANEDLKQLVEQMVSKMDMEMAPYYDQIEKKGYSMQKLMTLASLVEKEYGSEKDRRKIAGVFLNRLDKQMPMQSDVAIHYALKNNKSTVSYDDLKVDSPYNLYKNKGLGPGPFDSPSIDSVQAVLNPEDRDKGYLYFVANIKSKKVYFTKDLDKHNENVDKLQKVNGYEK